MAPTPDLILDMDPSEAGSEIVRTVVLPWSGQSVPLRIPGGLSDGAVLRLPGIGPATIPGGPPRDAYLQVRIVSGGGGAVPLQPATAPFGAYPPVSGPPTAPYGVGPPNPPFAAPPPQFGAFPPPSPAGGSGRGKVLAIVGAAVALVLLIALAVPLLFWVNSRNSGRSPSQTSASGPAGGGSEASAAPISAQEYQALLAEVDKAVEPGFARLGAARNPKAVGSAVNGIEAELNEQIAALSKVVPPTNAATAHSDLLRGLEGMTDTLVEAGSAAGAGEVCLGSSALARLSRDTSTDDVRSAQQALATADPAQPYQVGKFVPKKMADSNRRLGNGTYIKRVRRGLGQLKIENGGSTDAVINLVLGSAKTPTVSVYVRAKGKHTVSSIKDGTYRVYTAGGKDWDGKARAFARDCTFQRFADAFRFTTTSTQYTIWSVTLTPVIGGNARTSEVDPDAFPGG